MAIGSSTDGVTSGGQNVHVIASVAPAGRSANWRVKCLFPAARTPAPPAARPASAAPAPGRDSIRAPGDPASSANAESESWSLSFWLSFSSRFRRDLALPDLLAELVNLVFLPDVADRRAGDQQAQKQRLQRRPEPDCRRLIFSIFCHLNFLQHPQLRAAAARIFLQFGFAGLNRLARPPISVPARAAAATPARPPRR